MCFFGGEEEMKLSKKSVKLVTAFEVFGLKLQNVFTGICVTCFETQMFYEIGFALM